MKLTKFQTHVLAVLMIVFFPITLLVALYLASLEIIESYKDK
jgi:hypothetical protein